MSGHMVKMKVSSIDKKWAFPKEKYFEWEEKDEWYGRKYNVGHEENVIVETELDGYIESINIYPTEDGLIRTQAIFKTLHKDTFGVTNYII